MNPEFYYITAENPTVKVPLKPQYQIILNYKYIIELVLPECTRIFCCNNQLTKLIIPNGCEYITCNDNQLTNLVIPMSCIHVSCFNNNLTRLIVPKNCSYVNCSGNKLPKIIMDLLESENPINIELANNLQSL